MTDMSTSEDDNHISNIMSSRESGFDADSLSAFVNLADGEGHRWPLKSDAHSRQTKYAVAGLQDELTKKNSALSEIETKTGASHHLDRLKLNDEYAKKILDATVDGLDYDHAVDTLHIDPSALQLIAADIASFLVLGGGRPGLQRSRMLQRLATLSRSNTTTDSQKNG